MNHGRTRSFLSDFGGSASSASGPDEGAYSCKAQLRQGPFRAHRKGGFACSLRHLERTSRAMQVFPNPENGERIYYGVSDYLNQNCEEDSG